MYATLKGTNAGSTELDSVFESLIGIADSAGWDAPDTRLEVEPDQEPLRDWSLEHRGPRNMTADFLLAVTAPRAPGMSPLPCRKTVRGPLFAVLVMGNYFGVWREGVDFVEARRVEDLASMFKEFLSDLRGRK
jgi:hypothetical protein|tara:strand:+ start:35 stop:433 length:399 start_codon:yes stop_codon:yes gene_type:complete